MKEKVAVRIQEVGIWESLINNLEYTENSLDSDILGYEVRIKEAAKEECDTSWLESELCKLNSKKKALAIVYATILKAIG